MDMDASHYPQLHTSPNTLKYSKILDHRRLGENQALGCNYDEVVPP